MWPDWNLVYFIDTYVETVNSGHNKAEARYVAPIFSIKKLTFVGSSTIAAELNAANNGDVFMERRVYVCGGEEREWRDE